MPFAEVRGSIRTHSGEAGDGDGDGDGYGQEGISFYSLYSRNFENDSDHISIHRPMMGRSRSLKLKTWPLRGGDDSIASPPSSPLTPLSTTTTSSPPPRFDSSSSSSSSSSSLASSVFFWAFGIVTVALSGLQLSYAPVASVKHMWTDRLFTVMHLPSLTICAWMCI